MNPRPSMCAGDILNQLDKHGLNKVNIVLAQNIPTWLISLIKTDKIIYIYIIKVKIN